jgi:DNA-3-methyladenine glycosylase
MDKLLKEDFYTGTTPEIAKKLIGKHLCHKTETGFYVGKIVETEAYVGAKDLACHSAKGRTARTEPMFGPAGHAYIYLIYGMYCCLNVVTQREGTPEAVLIRSLEPLILDGEKIKPGQELYRENKIEKILNGPGKLCREFKIERELNGVSLMRRNGLWLEDDEDIPKKMIVSAKRIGVDYAKEWKDEPLRFYIRDNRFVSKK